MDTYKKENIKRLCSNCNVCELYDNFICFPELVLNNKESNFKCDIIIISDSPSLEDIRNRKPLTDKCGRYFRRLFNKVFLNFYNYIITNSVMCLCGEKSKSGIIPKTAKEECVKNILFLIKKYNPKCILVLGKVPLSILLGKDYYNYDMNSLRNQSFFINNVPIFLVYNPKFLLKNDINKDIKEKFEKIFLEDLQKVKLYLEGVYLNKEKIDIYDGVGHIPHFILDEKFYVDYNLFNIQIYNNVVYYIFIDKGGNKFFLTDILKGYFFYSKKQKDLPFKRYDELFFRKFYDDNKKKDLERVYTFYEEDVTNIIRRSIDYFYVKRNMGYNNDYYLKKMYLDIEVYTYGKGVFPFAYEAEYPISIISYKFVYKDKEEKAVILVNNINNKKLDSYETDDFILKVFNSEIDMLSYFCRVISDNNPSVIIGWNIEDFDIMTIVNRMKKLGMDISYLSPVNKVYLRDDGKYYNIIGLVLFDLYKMHKRFGVVKEDNYKLEYIANKYLGVSKEKFEGSLDNLFDNNFDKFLKYCYKDVDLLYKLDIKFGYLELFKEMINICSTTWERAESSMGLIEPLILSYAKRKGYICKDNNYFNKIDTSNKIKKANDDNNEDEEEGIIGAYVRNPKPGLFKNVVDFDFTSLYPSIIQTFNISPDTYYIKILDEKFVRMYIYERDRLNLYYYEDSKISIIRNPLSNIKEEEVSFKELLKELENKIICITGCVFEKSKTGFFVEIINDLLEKRIEYKNLMKKNINNNELYNRYNMIQLAYKILSNALYGVLANKYFRFYSKDLGETISLTGQEVSKFCGYYIEKKIKNENLDINSKFLDDYDDMETDYVLYQDTDSLFLKVPDK